MSDMLKILQAKPNPFGRDKAGANPIPAKLLGEWVDIKNTGTVSIPFKSIALWHETFKMTGAKISYGQKVIGRGTVKPCSGRER